MITKFKQALINKFPELYVFLSKIFHLFLYRKEANIVKHRPPPPTNNKNTPTCYFTYYRCGSQFLKKNLAKLHSTDSPVTIDIESYLMHIEPTKGNIENRFEELKHCFKAAGYFHGPLYHCLDGIFDHKEIRSFCILRDPRDVLVSHYYSLGFAHTITNKEASNRRKSVAKMSIDEFVVHPHYLDDVINRYTRYLSHFKLNSTTSPLYRYEDMRFNFDDFFPKLIDFIGYNPTKQDLSNILNEDHFSVTAENPLSHKRSGNWGQFYSKLKPETLKILNSQLGVSITSIWDDMSLSDHPNNKTTP